MPSKSTTTISARVSYECKETIETALKMGNSTTRDLMIEMADKLRSGAIGFEDGKIIIPETNSEYNLGNLIDACENKGIKVQDAINKAAQMVWRS